MILMGFQFVSVFFPRRKSRACNHYMKDSILDS